MSDGFIELPLASPGPITRSPKNEDPIIGIDLGTTNSLVAIVENGVPTVIRTADGSKLVPSVVHFDSNGNAEIGNAARKQRVTDYEHTIYSVKRLLGRGLDDIKKILGQLPFDLEESSSSNVKIKIAGKSYTPIEISALILKELKQAAEDHLGRAVEDAVITVPAYFNDSQRQATRAAGRLAGLNVLRILNEPTAASLAYGLQEKKNGIIAVYDLGGGTFDISILKLQNGIFEVLATNGDTALGGDDFDHAIVEWIQNTIAGSAKSQLTELFSQRDVRAKLLDIAEKLKIELSTNRLATKTIDLGSHGTFEITLNRTDLAKLIMPILERTRLPVESAIKDAKIQLSDLTDVVLVGGPTRIQCLQCFVGDLFQTKINATMHPDEVVALGAAIQADILAGGNRDFLLLDVAPLSLGIETFGGTMNKLIPRNTRIPTMAKEQFTTYVDGQTKVAINVFQGERELVKENRKLSEFVLHGVPPLPAGVARVEVTFLVDADGILSVTAREIYSDVEASIEVKPTYGLTDAEVERMLADGLQNAAADRDAAKIIEAKNDAQTILQATEKSLARVKEQLTDSEITTITNLTTDLRAAINRGDLVAIKKAHSQLNTGTTHLAELLMTYTMENKIKNKRVDDVLKKR